MLRIDGERKRQSWLRLRIVRGQSRDQNESSDTYIYIEKSRIKWSVSTPMMDDVGEQSSRCENYLNSRQLQSLRSGLKAEEHNEGKEGGLIDRQAE